MMNCKEKRKILPEIKNVFRSFNKKRLIKTEILEQSRDTVEINLINLNYTAERLNKFKILLILLISYFIYKNLLARYIFIDLSLVFISLLLLRQTFRLIKKDSICFYGGLALRMETTYFCNLKNSLFLPTDYIFDVIINEVITNLCVKYILIIRTKKEVYKEKPIIPVLMELEPGIECLEIVYRKLREKISLYNDSSL